MSPLCGGGARHIRRSTSTSLARSPMLFLILMPTSERHAYVGAEDFDGTPRGFRSSSTLRFRLQLRLLQLRLRSRLAFCLRLRLREGRLWLRGRLRGCGGRIARRRRSSGCTSRPSRARGCRRRRRDEARRSRAGSGNEMGGFQRREPYKPFGPTPSGPPPHPSTRSPVLPLFDIDTPFSMASPGLSSRYRRRGTGVPASRKAWVALSAASGPAPAGPPLDTLSSPPFHRHAIQPPLRHALQLSQSSTVNEHGGYGEVAKWGEREGGGVVGGEEGYS
ncbi:hypothetical protein MSAN_02431800 [Mycena sanguinolenta]|uniref:Uncharacterized protein n=1 Tax=Mycena sanguinolenta TaxID=230812 RepID=A0A8H6X2D9_9AGAR|nr:hypothetical protein MSAN_02431800 [Mycena sanguinolenta]